jgi:hypothetical protein
VKDMKKEEKRILEEDNRIKYHKSQEDHEHERQSFLNETDELGDVSESEASYYSIYNHTVGG